MKDIRVVAIIIFVIIGIWSVAGQDDRRFITSQSFGQISFISPADQDSGSQRSSSKNDLDEIQNDIDDLRDAIHDAITSPLAGRVHLQRARATDDRITNEYITLKTSGEVTLNGLRIESRKFAHGITLGPSFGEGFFKTRSGQERIVTVPKGASVHLITGPSPVGASFRINQCSGYLDQFHTIVPSLSHDCPEAIDELSDTELYGRDRFKDECIEIIEDIRECRIYQDEIPRRAGEECEEWIEENIRYNGCVANHQYDAGFEEDEWHIYLRQYRELWGNEYERIQLLDGASKLIDEVSY